MWSIRKNLKKATLVELIKLAAPMVVSQGTFAVMIFTDRYFMSQIDPVHMAAALGGGVASFFSFCFFVGLLAYANAMAAQYLGAGEPEKCPKVGTQGLIMTIMSAPFLTLITFLVAGIFEPMGHEPEQVELVLFVRGATREVYRDTVEAVGPTLEDAALLELRDSAEGVRARWPRAQDA